MVLASESAAASVVTPGNYDGVHLGHRALLAAARAVSAAAGGGLRVVAMTFDPHPMYFVAPERAPELLTTPQRRAELLRGLGADEVVVRRFDAAFAALSPEQFAEQVLGVELGARAVVVGDDFHFGTARAGDVAMLHRLGERHGFQVVEVPKVMMEGEAVSSSRIRQSLGRGEVELAARMLGRVHETTRRVIRGDQRGRTIGVPTANLELTGTLPPAQGVYAVVARVLGDVSHAAGVHVGVANLGTRPTVAAGRSFEVHLLDFDQDIYDRELRVGFVGRLRDEQRFSDLAALKAQIARDIEAARRALEGCAPELLTWI
jgi:riboflavin kinase/FMN adenylyltransferase